MFFVGNWAPGLQTEVKKEEKVPVVRRRSRPEVKRQTLDTDKLLYDRLISVSERASKGGRKFRKACLGCE